MVLIGPDDLRNSRWNGVSDGRRGLRSRAAPTTDRRTAIRAPSRRTPRARLARAAQRGSGRRAWAGRCSSPSPTSGCINARARSRIRYSGYRCASAPPRRCSVCSGTRKLTGRLQRLAASVAAVGQNESEQSGDTGRRGRGRAAWPARSRRFSSDLRAGAPRAANLEQRARAAGGREDAGSGAARRGVALCRDRPRASENRPRSARHARAFHDGPVERGAFPAPPAGARSRRGRRGAGARRGGRPQGAARRRAPRSARCA